MLRQSFLVALLCLSSGAVAGDVRIAIPKSYLEDAFLKSLRASKALSEIGVIIAPLPKDDSNGALAAVMSGAAELGVFTLAERDQHALEKAGPEASLLTRPFLFKSAKEVSLMQNSFLGEAAMADASRTGLFPLKLWNHSVTYLLTKTPVRTEADLQTLTLAANAAAPGFTSLSSLGASMAGVSPHDAMSSSMGGKVGGFETSLDRATQAFADRYDGKLFLTTAWPQTGVLAAAPNYWRDRSEAEKNAWKSALATAAIAAEAEIAAREEAIRKHPNIEPTVLDSAAQMRLATRAAGGDASRLDGEMRLWGKAEAEVHRAPEAVPVIQPPPHKHAHSPVFFVTDRNDEQTLDYAMRFGSRRLAPGDPTCGFLGAPDQSRGDPPLPEAPETLTKGEQACVRLIVDKVRVSGVSKILFVLHGFNTSFEFFANRILTLGRDLDYAGAIVGWSWPSEGSAFGYAYDEDSSGWSQPHFADFVRAFAEAAPDIQLDFVAHSMGNRILLQTLREYGQYRANLRIGAAVFAAPDVAQDIFVEQTQRARDIATFRTLYASEYDHAILISESYHKAPRAGSGGANTLVMQGVESVDARLSGHSYLFDEAKAMKDFKQILNEASAAAARGLEARAKGAQTYWIIEP
ncbi:alpha/beta hydrolase [Rhodoblastus acidophilus]|uniref:Alpha/beta hydrolase n=1 Tax=Rhodoblastus acidophilus TaxID=1074 RepID=A0A6N8DSA9_RHOAC|nr:alpha/beta hydrolase [Rhodoblastus acidophilus]MCW2273723.1 TRAP-type C4-dicarboxylate transport system substrate-binding protein/pimeloyl-ACP methyl ester carboxylesterase [Rhodoblastus acidophilus]MTV32716.1 alpha/beta hydrolase [Rhodoblastus acidophilus]